MNHGSPGGNPRNLEGDGQCGGRLVGHGVWSEGAGFSGDGTRARNGKEEC